MTSLVLQSPSSHAGAGGGSLTPGSGNGGASVSLSEEVLRASPRGGGAGGGGGGRRHQKKASSAAFSFDFVVDGDDLHHDEEGGGSGSVEAHTTDEDEPYRSSTASYSSTTGDSGLEVDEYEDTPYFVTRSLDEDVDPIPLVATLHCEEVDVGARPRTKRNEEWSASSASSAASGASPVAAVKKKKEKTTMHKKKKSKFSFNFGVESSSDEERDAGTPLSTKTGRNRTQFTFPQQVNVVKDEAFGPDEVETPPFVARAPFVAESANVEDEEVPELPSMPLRPPSFGRRHRSLSVDVTHGENAVVRKHTNTFNFDVSSSGQESTHSTPSETARAVVSPLSIASQTPSSSGEGAGKFRLRLATLSVGHDEESPCGSIVTGSTESKNGIEVEVVQVTPRSVADVQRLVHLPARFVYRRHSEDLSAGPFAMPEFVGDMLEEHRRLDEEASANSGPSAADTSGDVDDLLGEPWVEDAGAQMATPRHKPRTTAAKAAALRRKARQSRTLDKNAKFPKKHGTSKVGRLMIRRRTEQRRKDLKRQREQQRRESLKITPGEREFPPWVQAVQCAPEELLPLPPKERVGLVLFDMDNTLLRCHTGGRFFGDVADLAFKVSPVFVQVVPRLLAEGVCVGVVTFSDDLNMETQDCLAGHVLVEALMHAVFENYYRALGQADAEEHAQQLVRQIQISAANPKLRNMRRVTSERMSNDKRWHIGMVCQRLKLLGCEVETSRIMLFDDRDKSVRAAVAQGVRGVHVDKRVALTEEVWCHGVESVCGE